MKKLFLFIAITLINYSLYSKNLFDDLNIIENNISVIENDSDKTYYSEGAHGIVEVGYAIGVSKFELNNLKFNFVIGHMFDSNFSLGFGFGIRATDYRETILIPLFADMRFYFTRTATSPYLQLSAGHSINSSERQQGGLHLQGVIGVNFLLLSNKNALHIGFGYEKQDLNGRPFSLISFNLGTSFF